VLGDAKAPRLHDTDLVGQPFLLHQLRELLMDGGPSASGAGVDAADQNMRSEE